MVAWDDPWLTFRTPCIYEARIIVLAFVGRVEPDAGIAALEGLVDSVVSRMAGDAYAWTLDSARAPRQIEVGGIPLLSSRVVYRSPVRIGG
jgi:hypothetical protein